MLFVRSVLILISILLSFINAEAQSNPACNNDRSAQAQIRDLSDLISGSGMSYINYSLDGLQKSIADANAKLPLGIKPPEKDCSQFLDKDGNIGPYGNMVINEISRPENKNTFFGSGPLDFKVSFSQEKATAPQISRKPLPPLCPQFEHLDPIQKKLFWVWYYRSWALVESTCGAAPEEKVKANNIVDGKVNPDTMDIGIFQLSVEAAQKSDRQDIRLNTRATGEGVPTNYNQDDASNYNLRDPRTNIFYATRTLSRELGERGRLTSPGDGTYWGTLHADDKVRIKQGAQAVCNSVNLRNAIREFPLCGAKKKEDVCVVNADGVPSTLQKSREQQVSEAKKTAAAAEKAGAAAGAQSTANPKTSKSPSGSKLATPLKQTKAPASVPATSGQAKLVPKTKNKN